jgi:hypothetical protein
MRHHRPYLVVVAVVSTLVAIGARVFTQEGAATAGPALTCNMQQYKAMSGLTAAVQGNLLVVNWAGSDGAEVRARYAIDNGQPIVAHVAVHRSGRLQPRRHPQVQVIDHRLVTGGEILGPFLGV